MGGGRCGGWYLFCGLSRGRLDTRRGDGGGRGGSERGRGSGARVWA